MWVHPSPMVSPCHVSRTTPHRPCVARGGLILTNDADFGSIRQKRCFPGSKGGAEHVVAAKCLVAFGEASSLGFSPTASIGWLAKPRAWLERN